MNKQTSPINTQNKKPFFRKMTEEEEFQYMGCEERPIIAEFVNFPMDGVPYNIDIVIDLWTNLEDQKVERLGFHCYTEDKDHHSYVFMFDDAQWKTRHQLKQIAREIMSVDYLSVVTFEANHFSTFQA